MIGAITGERGEGGVEGVVAEAVVDLDAIAHNVALLAERALMDGDHPSALMAVVKADAFGHGIIPVSQARGREVDGTVRVHGIWSHLASADDPGNPSVPAQLETFDRALEVARDRGLDPDLRHLANSAGILDVPQSHFDLVRAGIAVY